MREENLYLLLLSFTLLVYMLIGAAIFSRLESDNEAATEKLYKEIFYRFQIEHNITENVMEKFLCVHEEAFRLGINSESGRKWDYVGAFYFAGTVISTIGFGLTAPATWSGQMFFLFYAMVGIPLNIIFLNTSLERLVATLTAWFNVLHKRLPRSRLRTFFEPRAFPVGRLLLFSFGIFTASMLILTCIFSAIEGWTFFEAFYFSIVACTTVGFGDFVPSKVHVRAGNNRHDAYRVVNWFLIGTGVVTTYIVLNLLANYLKTLLWNSLRWLMSHVCPSCLKTQVEPIDDETEKQTSGKTNAKTKFMKKSRSSHVKEAGDIGSFAAIQLALDRIKADAELNSTTEGQHGLKALSTIENLLRAEYKRVQMQRGNSPRARWLRAYAKVKNQSRINKWKHDANSSYIAVPVGQSSSGLQSQSFTGNTLPVCMESNGHLPGQIDETNF